MITVLNTDEPNSRTRLTDESDPTYDSSQFCHDVIPLSSIIAVTRYNQNNEHYEYSQSIDRNININASHNFEYGQSGYANIVGNNGTTIFGRYDEEHGREGNMVLFVPMDITFSAISRSVCPSGTYISS